MPNSAPNLVSCPDVPWGTKCSLNQWSFSRERTICLRAAGDDFGRMRADARAPPDRPPTLVTPLRGMGMSRPPANADSGRNARAGLPTAVTVTRSVLLFGCAVCGRLLLCRCRWCCCCRCCCRCCNCALTCRDDRCRSRPSAEADHMRRGSGSSSGDDSGVGESDCGELRAGIVFSFIFAGPSSDLGAVTSVSTTPAASSCRRLSLAAASAVASARARSNSIRACAASLAD